MSCENGSGCHRAFGTVCKGWSANTVRTRWPSVHCLTKSRFSQLDLAGPHSTVATVFAQHGVTWDSWVLNHQRQYERRRKSQKMQTASRRHWEKSFHHVGLSNVLSRRKNFLKSHVPLERCRLVLLLPEHMAKMRHQRSWRLSKQSELQQFWDCFGKYELPDLFSWLSCCLAADGQLLEDPAVQNSAEQIR